MSSKDLRLRVSLLLLLLGLVAAVPAFAGSAVIGSVAGAMNATVGGQAVVPNTTLFSGDSLQVKDGVAVVAIGGASRMVFGRDTVASFLRDTGEVTVLLGQGNVSMYHPNDSVALRVKIGDVSVVPATGFKTLGEVAMLNGAIVVTAKEGMLRVEGNGSSVNVVKGKTITVTPTVRKAQGGAAAGGGGVSSSTGLQAASLGVGAVSMILSGVAMSRAGDAKDAAANAVTAANSAGQSAKDAIAAADAATAAAEAAATNANTAGCALNDLAINLGVASTYTPPEGYSCE